MEKRMVKHKNWIGHEINESLRYHANDVLDREIYCRKKHQILEPTERECSACSCLIGWMQGHGLECEWEDVTQEKYDVRHEDRYKEYERVDKLIKLGVLERNVSTLIAKVKNLPYDDSVWIYNQSDDLKNRYLLGKRGEKTLVCCGVNPSVASPLDLDPTMKNVEGFVKANGYDGYVMINLYPMRETNPNNMHKVMDESIVMKNLECIRSILSAGNCDIWAAWGTLINSRPYLKDCLRQIVDLADTYHCNWYTIGKRTKEGHPHHPLYLSKECGMEKFDVHSYLENLK